MIQKIIKDIEYFNGLALSVEGNGIMAEGVYLGSIEYAELMNDPKSRDYLVFVQYNQFPTIAGVPIYQVNAFHHYNVG